MPAPDPTTDFTALADAGWPTLERVPVGDRDGCDGWVARFAGGVTQRANSVLVRGEVGGVAAAIDTAESLYRERGLRPVFQLTPRDAALECELLARGYAANSETLVMAADAATLVAALGDALGEQAGAGPAPASLAETPYDEWLNLWWAVDGRGGEPEKRVVRDIMTGAPALYATVCDEEGAASVGRLALVEQQDDRADEREGRHGGRHWGGLYALATRADARGRGHARAVIAALVREGRARGVTGVWLQVLAENAIARRLYDRIGFAAVDAYRYLAAPTT